MENNGNNNNKVQFENQGFGAIQYYREEKVPPLVNAVINYSGGVIKNKEQAGYALIVISILLIILSISLFVSIILNNKNSLSNDRIRDTSTYKVIYPVR